MLSVLGADAEDIPYFRRVTVPGTEFTAFAVSSAGGPRLITAYAQTEVLEIDTERALTEDDLRHCTKELGILVKKQLEQRQRLRQAEQRNKEAAALHFRFLTQLTVRILRQLEEAGYTKSKDAIKQLDTSAKGTYFAELPVDPFAGKASELLFAETVTSSL